MTAENKAAAQAAILRLQASGGTNLSGGLFKGIDQHQQAATLPEAADQAQLETGQLPASCACFAPLSNSS